MSIGKPRGKKGMLPVYVYHPGEGRKKYVGSAPNKREARLLEAKKQVEFSEEAGQRQGTKDWTVAGWAQHWLEHHHGANTKRPETTTYTNNEQLLRRFIALHGGTKLKHITRDDAHAWARTRPHEAKAIAAMFNDALDKRHIPYNPFARLGLHRGKGRHNIDPLTADEIATLADLARQIHGLYGDEFAALITFAAWTGMRPGEICGLEWTEIDLRTDEIHVWWARRNDGARVRTKTKENRTIALAPQAREALLSLPRRPGAVFRSPTGKELRPNSLHGKQGLWTPVRAAFEVSRPADHWLPRRLRQDPTDRLVPYELRHFCASHLADQGCTIEEIAEHLGNSPEVCRVYVHAHRDRVRGRIRAAFGSNVRQIQPVEGDRLGKQVG